MPPAPPGRSRMWTAPGGSAATCLRCGTCCAAVLRRSGCWSFDRLPLRAVEAAVAGAPPGHLRVAAGLRRLGGGMAWAPLGALADPGRARLLPVAARAATARLGADAVGG